LADDNVVTKDRGPPGLMKLSPNKTLAILQRQKNSVDVVMLEKNDGTVAVEFNVPTKSKDTILSVDWITNNQILFVTKQSLEIFSLNEEKGTAKLLRNLNVSASWSIFYAKSSLIILATGNNCTTMQPFLVQYGQFTRLKVLLGFSFLVLCSRCSGGFGIHVIDNLIIVHHQGSAKSMIFDVALSPSRLTHSPLMTVSITSPVCQPPPALYVPLWSMFQPDIVVDPVAGIMYQLTFCCDRAHEEIHDKCMLIEFLIHRTNQKALVLNTLLLCLKKNLLRLRQIRRIFNLIVEKSTSYLTPEANPPGTPLVCYLLTCEMEMHSNIFIPFMVTSHNPKFVADILLQYLRSLYNWEVPVEVNILQTLHHPLLRGRFDGFRLLQSLNVRC
uniref:Mic1 domain-containing protein n=1 Tax=Angiostrongylus cantonensis TaxID=6313 RepID=A0A0K0DJ71_ANGCA